MDSPTHRANIVNGDYTEIGVGTAKGKFDGYDTVYVVQLFGTPAIPPTPAPATSPVATIIEESVTTPVTPESPLEDAVAGIDADLAVVSTTEPTTVTTTEATITPPVIVNDRPVMASSKYRIEDVGSEVVTVTDDSVIIESTIATSSGLAVANIVTDASNQAGTTAVFMATQPNELLQWIYITLGTVVVALLLSSAVFELRRFHYLQVAYSFLLFAVMGGLFFIHSLLTGGAVIA